MAFLQVDVQSVALHRKTHINVFLPTDVYPSVPGPYPTLYLLHGIFGNSSSWVTSSNVQRYAEAKHVAVVMPDGENGFYLDHPDYMNDYAAWVGEELMESTRRMFPLSHERADTWLGGLSMGGYGALRNGLLHPETFGTIIAFSSALILESLSAPKKEGPVANEAYMRAMFGDPATILESDKSPLFLAKELVRSGKPLPKLYLSCGEQDGLCSANAAFADAVKALGFDLTFRTTPGNHDWDFWEQEIRHVLLDWIP